MSIVVEQFFHPVGHGTFHTGIAQYSGEPCALSWVYDCGSKRRSTLDSAIQSLSQTPFGAKRQIDLLVISHFDDDHVNGVESLLATWSVKWLVLPYTDLAPRLAQAAAVDDEPCSPSTVLFQLDPVQWLAVRGLSERVENLLFVEGGPSPDTPVEPRPQGDDPDRPHRPLSKEDDDRTEQPEGKQPRYGHGTNLDELVTPLNSFGTAPRLALLQHSQPVQALGSDLEFMFYNSDQPDMCRTRADGVRIARRSKAPLAVVEAEILQLTQQLQVGRPGVKPQRQWRKKLRDAYDRHFGKSSQARNNISLCLMTRVSIPLCKRWCFLCELYGQRYECNCGPYGRVCRQCKILYLRRERGYPGCSAGTASLCLGDLTVTASTIDSMQRHFAHRWDALAAVQVPHHGSHHSWSKGNATRFDPYLFVQCVPDASRHHPHPSVESDIRQYCALRANYSQGVKIKMRAAGWFKYYQSP